FEYNGMVLHEYYFGNLTQNGDGNPGRDSDFRRAAEASFGRYDIWKADFVGIGQMRGVGWAICYQDPANGSVQPDKHDQNYGSYVINHPLPIEVFVDDLRRPGR